MFFEIFVFIFSVAVMSQNLVEIAREVNEADLSWKAAEVNEFSTWSEEELKQLLGYPTYDPYASGLSSKERKRSKKVLLDEGVFDDLPKQFDWRNSNFSHCVHPIMNQGSCGSCYAFGTAEAFSDRLCIWSKGQTDVVISPQNLMDCGLSGNGCNGGIPLLVWEHIRFQGVVSDKCVPYTMEGQSCEKTCKNESEPFTKYTAKKISLIEGTKRIMKDLMNNGPQTVGFLVYEDFYQYQSGVYVHHTGKLSGGHAVKFVGWGETEDGIPYWIVANSWGKRWGMDGFFWIKRGVFPLGECLIEGEVVGGIPKF